MKKFLASMLLVVFGVGANASSVSLIYTGANDLDDDGRLIAALGDTLTFDLVMDFSDLPTLGGGFDINWNPNVFQFESYNDAGLGEPDFSRDPVLEDGRLFNGAIGRFNGLTTGTIASLSFTLIGFEFGSAITPSGTDGDSGPWIDGSDWSINEPDYNGVLLGVPLPAAVWLMLSGVGVLLGVARRNVASSE